MVAVAGVNCTVAVRFVTEVVASGAEAVVVSVTVSVLEGAVTVRVAVLVVAGAVVVAAVVLGGGARAGGARAERGATASSTDRPRKPTDAPRCHVETLARGLRPRNGVATTVHGVPASSARHAHGQLDSLSVSTGGAPRLALLFELLLLDFGRGVRLLDELLAA